MTVNLTDGSGEILASALVYCPMKIAEPLEVETISRNTVAWMQIMGLLQDGTVRERFLKIDAPGLASYSCPEAKYDDCLLIAKWVGWLYILDDMIDEDGFGKDGSVAKIFFTDLLQVFDNPMDATTMRHALFHSLADISNEMRKGWPDEYLDRVSAALWEYFMALMWEDANRDRCVPPDLSTYTNMRRRAGAIYLMFELVDVVIGEVLSTEERQCKEIAEARRHAASAIGWANDIFSVDREERAGDLHNVVFVLQHERGISREQATFEAIDLHNSRIAAFLKVKESINDSGWTVGKKYVKGLSDWIKGAYQWSLTTPRYKDATVRGDGSRESLSTEFFVENGHQHFETLIGD